MYTFLIFLKIRFSFFVAASNKRKAYYLLVFFLLGIAYVYIFLHPESIADGTIIEKNPVSALIGFSILSGLAFSVPKNYSIFSFLYYDKRATYYKFCFAYICAQQIIKFVLIVLALLLFTGKTGDMQVFLQEIPVAFFWMIAFSFFRLLFIDYGLILFSGLFVVSLLTSFLPINVLSLMLALFTIATLSFCNVFTRLHKISKVKWRIYKSFPLLKYMTSKIFFRREEIFTFMIGLIAVIIFDGYIMIHGIDEWPRTVLLALCALMSFLNAMVLGTQYQNHRFRFFLIVPTPYWRFIFIHVGIPVAILISVQVPIFIIAGFTFGFTWGILCAVTSLLFLVCFILRVIFAPLDVVGTIFIFLEFALYLFLLVAYPVLFVSTFIIIIFAKFYKFWLNLLDNLRLYQ